MEQERRVSEKILKLKEIVRPFSAAISLEEGEGFFIPTKRAAIVVKEIKPKFRQAHFWFLAPQTLPILRSTAWKTERLDKGQGQFTDRITHLILALHRGQPVFIGQDSFTLTRLLLGENVRVMVRYDSTQPTETFSLKKGKDFEEIKDKLQKGTFDSLIQT